MEKLRITVPPLYADEVNIEAGMKFDIDKDKKGKKKITKAAHIQLLFWDKLSQMVVSRVELDIVTAKKLTTMLKQNVERVMDEIHKRELPEAVKKQIEEQKLHPKKEAEKKGCYFG